ncbi:MAG: amidohydrolase [Eubacteriales bacterium]|nr:amidohydrolase [Eubacteriales bacterium]
MEKNILDKITGLRRKLYENAEISGQEKKTKKILEDFLRDHTSMELLPCGRGFYAAHREEGKTKPSICLRADYDALALPEGGAAHLCGHDGHSAALCGAALMLEGQKVGRDVFFLFQPEEETGSGAPGCVEIFDKEEIEEIYGGHNIPGRPLGQVSTKPGTLSCASLGLTLTFLGKAAHAATPENGISPATAVGRLLCSLPEMARPEDYEGLILATVIGVQMGEKAFGAAAADAEVWLTLRGEHDRDLERLYEKVCDMSKDLAEEFGLKLETECQDVFPASENDEACARKVLEIGEGVEMPEAMRWSEDFGHYLKRCRGAYFMIGAGEEQTPLHGEGYEYPDALLEPTAELFWKLIMS